jgi:hypothetical protein
MPMPMQQPGAPMYQANFANDPTVVPPPQFCPPGPGGPGVPAPNAGDAFTLPNDGSPNAFCDEPPCNEGIGCCVNIGALGLIRQSLNGKTLGFLDPGIVLNGQLVHIDTGLLPPAGSPEGVNAKDVGVHMHGGVQASMLFREGDQAFEIAGWYLPRGSSSQTITAPGQLDLGFGFFPLPLGFQPDNNLFLQADRTVLTLETTMYSGEANYRFNSAKNFEWIVGVRYLDYQERYGIFVDDDSLVTGVFNPNLAATYTARLHNRLTAAQLGFETEQVITSRIGVGAWGKAAWGANFLDVDTLLQRADGFLGPHLHHSDIHFGHMYEFGVFADFLIFEQCKIRAGYRGMFLVDVGQAPGQINFNLGAQTIDFNGNSSIFFHGPMLEVQFVF